MTRRIIASLMLACFLTACAQDGSGYGMNKQTVGGLAGAGLGGLAGSAFGKGNGRLWTTGAGVLLGALAGSSVGSSLDKADQMYASRAMTQAQTAPVGQTITWNNPDNGNTGTVVTTRTGRSAGGLPCREYQQNVTIGGKTQQIVGTACQNGDGTWAAQP
jgi:surface antigen